MKRHHSQALLFERLSDDRQREQNRRSRQQKVPDLVNSVDFTYVVPRVVPEGSDVPILLLNARVDRRSVTGEENVERVPRGGRATRRQRTSGPNQKAAAFITK